jgi:glyoxylate reductase
MKVFITYKIPNIAEKILREKGFTVSVNRSGKILTKEELIRKGKNADALITLLSDKIDREVIDNLNKCRIIANYAVGYNNIDVEYAKSRGIVVANTPGILTDATADLTMALILACARRLPEGERFVREGKFEGWKPELLLGLDLKGKTLGIVGMGRIGFAVGQRAKAFGMKVVYFNRTRKANAENELNAKKVSLEKLMKVSDVVSLHLPLTAETRGIIDKNKLNLLKPTAILINTARGEVLDEKHLIKMLKRKKIFAAGFDVYTNEPNLNPALLELENAVLLPHVGSGTVETRNAMAELVARNVVSYFQRGKAVTPVL